MPCRRTGGCNPYVPAELRGNETPSTGAGIAWGRRFDEVDGQITENKRETIRSWAGLRGKISDSWNWEASFGYGQSKQDQWRRNELNGMNLGSEDRRVGKEGGSTGRARGSPGP